MGRSGGERTGRARTEAPAAARRHQAARSTNIVLPAMALVALTFVAYLPALQASFIWDDDVYIWHNPHLEGATGLRNIWLRPSSNMQYYPLTFTALWVQHHLWGADPVGYHAVNVALHAACAVLFLLLLRALGVGGAWAAAAVFAVHPVFVESVAWCSELKNVLSGALYLLCLLAYFRAAPAAAPPAPEPPTLRRWYATALVLFAAALLAKPAAVALPLVILLIVWWKQGHVGADDALRVAPMLVLGLAMGLVTTFAEKEFSGAGWEATPVERGLVAGRALVFYVSKLVWPSALSSVYPRWEVSPTAWWQYVFPLAAAAVVAALWLLRKTLGRGPLAAALSYVLLVAPALGFFDLAYYRYSFVADHFQYHAAPALIVLLTAAVAGARQRLGTRRLAVGIVAAGAALVVLLGVLTWRHARTFENDTVRCLDTISKNPRAWVAMHTLASLLAGKRRHREAIPYYEQALRLNPDSVDLHLGLGTSLSRIGDNRAAERHFREAHRLSPENAEANTNVGRTLAQRGDFVASIPYFREAIRVHPRHVGARVSLGMALVRLRDPLQAIEHFEAALAVDPGNALARQGLERARTMAQAGSPTPTGSQRGFASN